MEGRTAYNSIHPKYILDIKTIEYMYSIINSDIDEEIKAMKLYFFCNEACLLASSDIYEYLGLEEVKKLTI